MSYEIIGDGKPNLVRKFIEGNDGLAGLLDDYEKRLLGSAEITLFRIKPQTRADVITGMHIICSAYFNAESRGNNQACAKIREFYETFAKEYVVSNEIDAVIDERERRAEEWRKYLIELGLAPSPSAAAGP